MGCSSSNSIQEVNQKENLTQIDNLKKNELNKTQIENLKKNGLNKIINKEVPKCNESLNLTNLENFFVEISSDLNEIEKAFFIYNWIASNISLDLQKQKDDENFLENIIKNGKSSNYNFAKLYQYLGEKINLKIKCIEGYSKNLDKIENIPKEFTVNHLYNIIDFSGKLYLIDSCFGSGYLNNTQYIREYNNFYFCIEPSKMILFNYPKDENYLLLEKKINYETFFNTTKFYINFFKFNLSNLTPTTSNDISKGIRTFKLTTTQNIDFFSQYFKEEKENKFVSIEGYDFNISKNSNILTFFFMILQMEEIY